MGGATRILFVLVWAVLVGCASQAAATKAAELPKPKRELELPAVGHLKTYENGLKLFVMPDAYTRLIQVDVRQRVGSRDDPPGKGGMAHFVEHLMFQMPADGPDSPKLMSVLPQHALTFNAYTSMDETHYMHTGMADELENYMKYTALRLNHDCATVSEEQFLREREVVRNEHRQRSQSVDVLVRDKVAELAFPKGHPYHRKTFGADADVASITFDESCEFIKKYYTASQANVIVTGDVDPMRVLELANKYLGALPKRKVAKRTEVPPPKFAKKKAQVVAPVKKPTAVVLFKLPKRFGPESAAANASIETLFLAVSFFTQAIPGQISVIKDISGVGLGGKEAQLFGVVVETKQPEQLDRAVDEVLDAVTRGFAADVSAKEYKGVYDSARQRARLGVLDSVSAVMSSGNAFADYLEEPNPGFYGSELLRLDNLTSAQIQTVGRSLFHRDEALVVTVVPDGKEDTAKADRASFDYEPKDDENLSVPADIDPGEANRALPIQDIAPPEGQSLEYELETGMRVVLVQSSQLPVMDIQVIIGVGQADAPEQPALAPLAVYTYGVADDRDARNLMSFFNAAGGLYRESVGALSSTFQSRGLAVYLDFIVAGLAEQVVHAEHQVGALDRWKLGQKERLKKENALQGAKRTNSFFNALYGEGHPYVRREIDDPKKLREVKFKDLENFRRTHFRAANATLIMTGGFDMDLAQKYVEAYFGKPKLRDRKNPWLEPLGAAGSATVTAPKPGKVRYLTEVDKERLQTDVRIAYPLAQAYGKDHAALSVMAAMLNFRVSEVRQKLGSSYGVYARLATERPRIELGGSLDSARAGEAFKAIRDAIRQMRDSEGFDRQFAFARRSVLRSMINAQGDPRLLAGQIAQAVQHGRSYEYFRDLATKVATLKPAAVKAQIDRVLKDEKSITLIQGPAAGIAEVVKVNKIVAPKKLPDVIHDEDED